MSEMVRKQIYIHKRHNALLERLSQARGVGEAEIIRQALDREAASASMALPIAEEYSWDKAVEFMRSLRQRADRFSEPLRWKRDELYEERLNRYAPRSPEQPDMTE